MAKYLLAEESKRLNIFFIFKYPKPCDFATCSVVGVVEYQQ